MVTRARAGWSGLLWTAPWWLGFLLLLVAPLGASLYISLCDYPLLQPPVFVGAANYATLAADSVFWRVVWNTLIYAALSIPLSSALAIVLAVLLNQRVRGQALFRACVFVPTIVPLVAAGVVWMWMLNPELGLINEALRALAPPINALNAVLGLTPFGRIEWLDELARGPLWLDSPRWSMLSLVLVSLWFVGSPTVICLAGLQEIPEELYEAARIDGASARRRFWHVTLPGLGPVILFNIILGVINAWQVFALPFVMWRMRPGPDQTTYFYSMYLYDNAFRYLKMGYASAMAWIQLLIILGLTGLVFLISRRSVYYRGA
jgi:multiple sugar transport system permease protein